MIADAAHIRTIGNLPLAVKDDFLKPHLRVASNRLAAWVGSDNYSASETEVATARAQLGQGEKLDVDALTAQARALIDAEAYLACITALPSLNMVMRDQAGVAKSGSAGKTEWDYLTPAEVQIQQDAWLRNAEFSAAGYIQQANLGPSLSHAIGKEGKAIDSDKVE